MAICGILRPEIPSVLDANLFKILVKVLGLTCEGGILDVLFRKVKLQRERKECNPLVPKLKKCG